MKKKIRISTAIPASMSDFTATVNPHLTSAKLKVFHQGKTADGRYFTENFANKLAATIGGTPVVASYDEERDDFVGHDFTQSVFGFVPEEAKVWTEKDETGNSWLTTEVRLFTERHDVGTIAKKIIGQSQSLELNPETVEVKFVESEDSDDLIIEFVDGDLIGLSVLGVSQQPAFTGSGFFEASTAESLEELIANYVSIPKEIVMETGGEDMDKVIIFKKDGVTIFKRDNRIYVETQDGSNDDITDALAGANEEIEPVEEKEVEEEELTVEDVINEDLPEDPAEEVESEETPEPTEPEVTPETPEAQEGAEEGGEDGTEGGEDFESEDAESTEEPEEEGVEPQAEEGAAHAAALAEAEREELNNYRREHKLSIIGEYDEFLSEGQLEDFRTRVDEFTKEDLEKELAVAAMNALRKAPRGTPTFGFVPTAHKKTSDDEVSSLIEQYNEVK